MVLALALMVGTAGAATSDNNTTEATVTAGSLFVEIPGVTPAWVSTFSTVVLNGDPQVSTAILKQFRVGDARGSGQGWHLTLQATRFTRDEDVKLAYGSCTMGALSVVKDPDSTDSSAVPTMTPSSGRFAIDTSSPVHIASAAEGGAGMGEYMIGAVDNALTL